MEPAYYVVEVSEDGVWKEQPDRFAGDNFPENAPSWESPFESSTKESRNNEPASEGRPFACFY